jgi:hypothetical protein
VIADKLNSIPKIVFSKSLKKAPWGKFPDAAISTDAIATVKELKTKQGKDTGVVG